mmetsp:Transcript_22100/g.66417  ORF Transcript_22100/g.66417 Transcript_22100/m.66417 type:complete len:246 (-) Transcript_22100:276-1013(-)
MRGEGSTEMDRVGAFLKFGFSKGGSTAPTSASRRANVLPLLRQACLILHQALRRMSSRRVRSAPSTPGSSRDRAITKQITAGSSGQTNSYDLSAVSSAKQSQGQTCAKRSGSPVSCPYFSLVTVFRSRLFLLEPPLMRPPVPVLIMPELTRPPVPLWMPVLIRPPMTPPFSWCSHARSISSEETETCRISSVPCCLLAFSRLRPFIAACISFATLTARRASTRTCGAVLRTSLWDLLWRSRRGLR